VRKAFAAVNNVDAGLFSFNSKGCTGYVSRGTRVEIADAIG
jgi:hypothetical protein